MVGEELREEDKGQFMKYFLSKRKVLEFIPGITGNH